MTTLSCKSIAELNKQSVIPDVKKDRAISAYYTFAFRLLEEADKYRLSGDLERTYIFLMRFVSLIAEKLPKHPNYLTDAATKIKRTALKKKCFAVVEELQYLKDVLKSEYDERSRAIEQKKRDEERAKQEAEKAKKEAELQAKLDADLEARQKKLKDASIIDDEDATFAFPSVPGESKKSVKEKPKISKPTSSKTTPPDDDDIMARFARLDPKNANVVLKLAESEVTDIDEDELDDILLTQLPSVPGSKSKPNQSKPEEPKKENDTTTSSAFDILNILKQQVAPKPKLAYPDLSLTPEGPSKSTQSSTRPKKGHFSLPDFDSIKSSKPPSSDKPETTTKELQNQSTKSTPKASEKPTKSLNDSKGAQVQPNTNVSKPPDTLPDFSDAFENTKPKTPTPPTKGDIHSKGVVEVAPPKSVEKVSRRIPIDTSPSAPPDEGDDLYVIPKRSRDPKSVTPSASSGGASAVAVRPSEMSKTMSKPATMSMSGLVAVKKEEDKVEISKPKESLPELIKRLGSNNSRQGAIDLPLPPESEPADIAEQINMSLALDNVFGGGDSVLEEPENLLLPKHGILLDALQADLEPAPVPKIHEKRRTDGHAISSQPSLLDADIPYPTASMKNKGSKEIDKKEEKPAKEAKPVTKAEKPKGPLYMSEADLINSIKQSEATVMKRQEEILAKERERLEEMTREQERLQRERDERERLAKEEAERLRKIEEDERRAEEEKRLAIERKEKERKDRERALEEEAKRKAEEEKILALEKLKDERRRERLARKAKAAKEAREAREALEAEEESKREAAKEIKPSKRSSGTVASAPPTQAPLSDGHNDFQFKEPVALDPSSIPGPPPAPGTQVRAIADAVDPRVMPHQPSVPQFLPRPNAVGPVMYNNNPQMYYPYTGQQVFNPESLNIYNVDREKLLTETTKRRGKRRRTRDKKDKKQKSQRKTPEPISEDIYIDKTIIHRFGKVSNSKVRGKKKMLVCGTMFQTFMARAEPNTRRNIETCGILCGRLRSDDMFEVTTLLIPKQRGDANTCATTDEEEIFLYQHKHHLLTLGWIHTHPSQRCFLSSVDMHTQCSYQSLFPEAIAVVIAPRYNPNFSVFGLTKRGLPIIQNCPLSGFHLHDETTMYRESEHIVLVWPKNDNTKVVDMRRSSFKV